MDSLSSFLNVKEVAEYLALKTSTVYSLVEEKKIPHYRINRQIRFKKSDIDEWMAGQREEVIDARVEAKRVVKSLRIKSDLAINEIVKKAIEEAGKKRYTLSRETRPKGPQKGGIA